MRAVSIDQLLLGGCIVLWTIVAPGAVEAQIPKGIVINEVVIDSRGGNPELEFIELHGPPLAPLAGLSVVCIEGVDIDQEFRTGAFLKRFDFAPDQRLNAGGFFLMANQRTAEEYGVVPDIEWPNAEKIPNDPQTVALVRAASLPAGRGLTSMAEANAVEVLDAVGLVDPQRSTIFFKAPRIGPDRTFIAAGAARVKDGVSTGQPFDWFLADIDGPRDQDETYNTPGRPNVIPDQVIISYAGTAVATAAPTSTAQVSMGGAQWRPFSPEAMATPSAPGTKALVYVRSELFKGCRSFEQTYLLHPAVKPLLAGKDLYFLNAHQPENGDIARQLGIYRVPTLGIHDGNGNWQYLTVKSETTNREIGEFLAKLQ